MIRILTQKKISQALARNFCEPTESLYKKLPELKDDPFKAMGEVKLVGGKESEITDPIAGLLVGAAKLETAKRELGSLNRKQKEVFSGIKENIDGAIAWAMHSKAGKKALNSAIVVSMTLSSAGCAGIAAKPIDISNTPPPIVQTFTPTPIERPTETQTPPGIEGSTYPTSSENFVKTPGISGAEARKIIVEKGVGEDLKALEKWYEENGIIGSGMSSFTVPVVYQEGGNFNWNLMVKKNNGNFLKFTLTSGPEAGQLVRAMGMVSYLASKPSFEVSELQDPAGMGNLNQQVIWDRSGWSVVGAFQGDNLIAWFNADAPNGGEWVKLQEIVPTATPAATEIPFDTSRFEVVDALDGNKYQGYLIEDEFGTRLVDDVNSVILVKDGDTWRPAESRNYSEEYPAVFYETKIGKADGFEIPITIGLSSNVREGIGFTYSEVHMTQLGADGVALMFLQSAWGRYRDIMNHPGVTYEEYLELLKKGEGNIEILDSITKKPVLIDPRQGYSTVITGDRKYGMPIRYYETGFHFTSDESGRLLLAVNSADEYHMGKSDNIGGKNSYFVLTSFASVSSLVYFPNNCMKSEIINSACGMLSLPEDIATFGEKVYSDVIDYYNNKSSDPLFILK